MSADYDWKLVLESLRREITDVKETIKTDVKEPLKQLTKIISNLAVQGERIDNLNSRVTATETDISLVWKTIHELKDLAIKATKQCNVANNNNNKGQEPQEWWDGKVAGFLYKLLWLVVAGTVGLILGGLGGKM